HRHPHVFAGGAVETEADARELWEASKRAEASTTPSAEEGLLDGVKRSGTALSIALAVQKKASSVGFDWDDVEGVWGKLAEEIEEFKAALVKKDAKEMEAEFGDILFVLVNMAKWYHLDPEIALL